MCMVLGGFGFQGFSKVVLTAHLVMTQAWIFDVELQKSMVIFMYGVRVWKSLEWLEALSSLPVKYLGILPDLSGWQP